MSGQYRNEEVEQCVEATLRGAFTDSATKYLVQTERKSSQEGCHHRKIARREPSI
jgi:hypothetical protein